jgi:hypothetical protein
LEASNKNLLALEGWKNWKVPIASNLPTHITDLGFGLGCVAIGLFALANNVCRRNVYRRSNTEVTLFVKRLSVKCLSAK